MKKKHLFAAAVKALEVGAALFKKSKQNNSKELSQPSKTPSQNEVSTPPAGNSVNKKKLFVAALEVGAALFKKSKQKNSKELSQLSKTPSQNEVSTPPAEKNKINIFFWIFAAALIIAVLAIKPEPLLIIAAVIFIVILKFGDEILAFFDIFF